MFLKERIPKTIDEMCTLADQVKEARQVSIVSLISYSRKETPFEQKNAGAGKDQNDRTEHDPKEMVVATSVLDQVI